MTHGSHWKCIENDCELTVAKVLPRVLAKGEITNKSPFQKLLKSGAVREETAHALQYPQTPLRYIAFCVSDSTKPGKSNDLFSAFPYCAEGRINRITVTNVADCGNPLEGIITGVAKGGMEVEFFDIDFCKNREVYKQGKAYDFSIAGLAYRLEKAKQDKILVTEGELLELERKEQLEKDPNTDVSKITSVEVSLEELRCLVPHKEESDAECRTIIDAVSSLTIEKVHFYRIETSLMTPDDIPFDWTIYASKAVLGKYKPKKGDSIESIVWLQGRLVSVAAYQPVEKGVFLSGG